MEKFLKLAFQKSKEFKLNCCDENERKESLKSILKQGVINVEGKEDMLRVAIKPDGNCQFRAVAAALTGSDDDSNHKIVRKLACDQFENETTEKLRRTGFFSHSETDCITEKACKKMKRHNGAYVGASVLPYKRIVKNKEEFTKQMRKNKVWPVQTKTKA